MKKAKKRRARSDVLFAWRRSDPGDLSASRSSAGPRWEHHSGVVDQENHVMTVGVDTV